MSVTSFKMTVREVAQGREDVQLFRELIDVDTTKCYGIQLLSAAEAAGERERFVGYYGRKLRTFEQPFEVQRGHKIVIVSASKRAPKRCWEHLYAEL